MKQLSFGFILLAWIFVCWGGLRMTDWPMGGRLIWCAFWCAMMAPIAAIPFFEEE